jgi:hypothetical protein
MPKNTCSFRGDQTECLLAEPPSSQFDATAVTSELEAACRLLPGSQEALSAISRFVSVMTFIAQHTRGQPGTAPAAYSDIGRSTAQRELRELSKLACRLGGHIRRLHQPTILALAAAGIFGGVRIELPQELCRLARQAACADVSDLPLKAKRGRKTDNLIATIGQIAGRTYSELTGQLPTFTTDPGTSHLSGHWPKFLRSVLVIMHMDCSADYLARKVAEAMRPMSVQQDGEQTRIIAI